MNIKPRIRAVPAGPEQQALDRSGPRRTRTAQDQNGPRRTQALDRSGPRRTRTASPR